MSTEDAWWGGALEGPRHWDKSSRPHSGLKITLTSSEWGCRLPAPSQAAHLADIWGNYPVSLFSVSLNLVCWWHWQDLLIRRRVGTSLQRARLSEHHAFAPLPGGTLSPYDHGSRQRQGDLPPQPCWAQAFQLLHRGMCPGGQGSLEVSAEVNSTLSGRPWSWGLPGGCRTPGLPGKTWEHRGRDTSGGADKAGGQPSGPGCDERQPPAWPAVNTRSLLHPDQKVVARSRAFSPESSSASSKHFTFRERKCMLSENLPWPLLSEDPKSRVRKEQGLLDTDLSTDFPSEARHPREAAGRHIHAPGAFWGWNPDPC